MNLNPIANGSKTAAGVNGTAGALWMTAALLILPKFGMDDATINLIIGFAPHVVLGAVGIGHKIVKAGGIVGVWKKFMAGFIGKK